VASEDRLDLLKVGGEVDFGDGSTFVVDQVTAHFQIAAEGVVMASKFVIGDKVDQAFGNHAEEPPQTDGHQDIEHRPRDGKHQGRRCPA